MSNLREQNSKKKHFSELLKKTIFEKKKKQIFLNLKKKHLQKNNVLPSDFCNLKKHEKSTNN